MKTVRSFSVLVGKTLQELLPSWTLWNAEKTGRGRQGQLPVLL